ncbi:MAG: PIN domain-containing protein [Candidatus Acidiferrales bacterium]
MDRLFLDANVLSSAASRPNAGLLRLWELSDCTLYTSRYAMGEARVNLAEAPQREQLEKLCRPIHLVDATSAGLPPGTLLPAKDRPILAAAIEANATHLLTGDVRDFGRLLGKIIAGVLIQLPSEYLKERK